MGRIVNYFTDNNSTSALIRVVFFILILIATFVFRIVAQDQNFPPPEKQPIVKVKKADGTIKIDGKLIDADWQKASDITDFFRIEPRQGGTYLYNTSVKFLYDDKNLYLGAYCEDSLGRKGIRVQDLRRDFSWGENDIFMLQLDPQNLKQYCVSFQTTPYGNQRDLQNFNDSFIDNDWNALWSVRTHLTDSGYFAEFAIPFKSIRYKKSEIDVEPIWGVTLGRLARRDYEQTVFPAIPQSFSPYRMTYAAQLQGLELPESSANIRVEPYLLYQYENLDETNTNTSIGTAKIGGDVKWAITPSAVLDMTFNTDFAQADVDFAVNNLERFNIFFPERRQFFLENSGIWAGASNRAIRPFFSRTIGLQGNFNAATARINAGARYTMRNEESAIAGLYINQAETENSPSASFAVARYLNNYGKENNVGLMITHRQDQFSESTKTQNSNNTTLTIDGFLRPNDKWTVSYMISGSRDNSNDTLGIAGSFFAGNTTNRYYLGWLTNFVSQRYNPDMGFVFQKNVIQHNPGGYYVWRPKNIPWIRRFDPGAFFNLYQDFNNPQNIQQANIYIFPIYLVFTNGSFIEYAILPTWQNIDFDFAPLGLSIKRGKYYYTRQQIKFNTDRSAKFSMSTLIDWGEFYNGNRFTLSGGIRFSPSPKLAFTLDHERNNLLEVGEKQQNLITELTTMGARLAANPRIQLTTFLQYNSFNDQVRLNVRGSWEYKPLSFIYLVFNNTNTENMIHTQQFIAKVTYLKQF